MALDFAILNFNGNKTYSFDPCNCIHIRTSATWVTTYISKLVLQYRSNFSMKLELKQTCRKGKAMRAAGWEEGNTWKPFPFLQLCHLAVSKPETKAAVWKRVVKEMKELKWVGQKQGQFRSVEGKYFPKWVKNNKYKMYWMNFCFCLRLT